MVAIHGYLERVSDKIWIFIRKSNFRPATLLKKETLAQMFSCEFCEISKNTFLQNTSGWLLLNTIETIKTFFKENLHQLHLKLRKWLDWLESGTTRPNQKIDLIFESINFQTITQSKHTWKKLTIETQEQLQCGRCGVFLLNFWTYFTPSSSVSFLDFEQVFVCCAKKYFGDIVSHGTYLHA